MNLTKSAGHPSLWSPEKLSIIAFLILTSCIVEPYSYFARSAATLDFPGPSSYDKGTFFFSSDSLYSGETFGHGNKDINWKAEYTFSLWLNIKVWAKVSLKGMDLDPARIAVSYRNQRMYLDNFKKIEREDSSSWIVMQLLSPTFPPAPPDSAQVNAPKDTFFVDLSRYIWDGDSFVSFPPITALETFQRGHSLGPE